MYATECVCPQLCPCAKGLLCQASLCLQGSCLSPCCTDSDPLCMFLMEMLPKPAEMRPDRHLRHVQVLRALVYLETG